MAQIVKELSTGFYYPSIVEAAIASKTGEYMFRSALMRGTLENYKLVEEPKECAWKDCLYFDEKANECTAMKLFFCTLDGDCWRYDNGDVKEGSK